MMGASSKRTVVIPGLVPGIQPSANSAVADRWMPGTSPGMTVAEMIEIISGAEAL